MQPENREDIPFLEKPNVEEIEKNIIESTLVLCISLNEKEVASLFAPCKYFLSVNRYMYLSNIVPKCIEHFKSFILPLYGNQCGVYFEIELNKKKRHDDSNAYRLTKGGRRASTHNSQFETSTIEKGTIEERGSYKDTQREREQEYIVLDWRLPIGVLFDTYCEFEVIGSKDEDEDKDEKEKEHEQGQGQDRIKANAVFCQSDEIVEDCDSIVKCINYELDTDRESREELNKEFTHNEPAQDSRPISDFHKKENKEPVKQTGKRNEMIFYKLVKKDHIKSEWYEQKFENMSKQNIPWKLRVCFKSEREYCHWDFMNSSQKNLVKKINLLPYNSCIPLYKGIHNFEEFLINQLIKASYIYKRSNRYIQKLPHQTEKEILFYLKNFNVEKICALYRQCINFNLVHSIDYFNNILREHFSSIKKWTKRNTRTNTDFNTVTHADVDINIKTSIYRETIGQNHNNVDEQTESSTSSKSSEHKEEITDAINDINTMKKKNDIKNNSIHHGNTKVPKQNRLFDLLKDEKAIEELPIVIHIYGPPYNQVVTKFQSFKIKIEENDKNKIEEFYAYTLGDFLHVQFPTFFRKVSEKTTRRKEKDEKDEKDEKHEKYEKEEKDEKEEKEQMTIDRDKEKDKNKINDETEDKNTDNDTKERRTDEAKTGEHNAPCPCVNEISYKELKSIYEGKVETVYFFKEDNFLIFSEYIFVIINGIQIPLSTPLYWLAMNFSQFDNFLHIILRVPPY